MKLNDLTGRVFGRWLVLSKSTRTLAGTMWNCMCECGTEKTVGAYHLLRGSSRSCGCLKRVSSTRKHPLYATWASIKTRTCNERSICYKHYGARGVSMAPEWRDDFLRFVEDMGDKPSPEHTINRIDNDGDYTPVNCVWSTRGEQARNRSDNVRVEHDGVSEVLVDFAVRNNVNYSSLAHRIKRTGETATEAAAILKAPSVRLGGCAVDGCLSTICAKGKCSKHYQSDRRPPAKKVRKDNTSGYRGVSYHKGTGKWAATKTVGGVRKNLGLFTTPDEARQALILLIKEN